MRYKITISRIVEDAEYEAKVKRYKEENGRFGMGGSATYPEQFYSDRVLEAELTEEEYKKVKSEVYMVFE